MRLTFIQGTSLRKVFIEGRKITFVTPELNFQPMTIDLDKLSSDEMKGKMQTMKLKDEDRLFLENMSGLTSEKDIAKDIKKDFRQTGWRLVKQE